MGTDRYLSPRISSSQEGVPFGFQNLPVGSSVLVMISAIFNFFSCVFIFKRRYIFYTGNLQYKRHNALLFFLLLLVCTVYSLCASCDENKLYKFFCIGVQLNNNAVLVSGVQQSSSVIHIHRIQETLFPFRLTQNIEQSSLCYAVGPCCLSI